MPPPAGSPEPITSSSTTDDDDMSYTSSINDDFQHTHTQTSTPETQHSWPVEFEQYSDWTSLDSFSTIRAPSSFVHTQQPQIATTNYSPPWDWTTTSMSPPPIMHFPPPSGYGHIPDPVIPPPYDVYGGAPAMLSPSPNRPSGRSGRGPTSSPVSRATGSASYQDVEDMSHFVGYGIQRQSSFQY